ncbi:MAG: glycerate kinase [Verrucomicrobiota bacterium JB023]|nr:glycerate kinase [Verrucomicrobiota bacterium JB023]
MKILIACDKFKGSLSSLEVAAAVQRGFGEGFAFDPCPLADGGEGFVSAMMGAMGGEAIECESVDALDRPITTSYGLSGQTAVIEMAAASGLWRIEEEVRDVLAASSYGTGLLMKDAMERGATKILLGLGGSATNDGGAGAAAALGWRFTGSGGLDFERPTPDKLAALEAVDSSAVGHLPRIEVACDVENPLFGARGATAIYGPQKGAGPEEREFLEATLHRLVETAGGADLAEIPGAGAAGGMGWGLMKFAGATLRPGFDLVADAVGLRERIQAADVVITGEGSLDGQSLEGKGPVGLARMAREEGKRVLALAGRITPEVRDCGLFEEMAALDETGLPLAELMARAEELTEEAARSLAGRLM